MKKVIALAVMACAVMWVSAAVTLAENGTARSRIILANNDDATRTAATLLQDFVGRISGAKLEISSAKPRKNDVVIGEKCSAGEDGFCISTEGDILRIKSGGDKGAAYGVVTLLEQYLGVNYYGFEEYDLTPMSTITLPQINRNETPAFRYRQTQSYCAQDPIYKLWYRLEEPNEVFISNMWVHTFNRILPSSRFGKAHPEYYSFINGERRPGTNSQWCLTNDNLFEAVCHQLDSIFAANPDKHLISVSQNDGNDTYCTCSECSKIDAIEGSPSGNFIRFLNRLATRYPDKEFSTLAYLFTMHAPKVTKPLPNVNIMLCDIDCKREVPLTHNASGQDFVRALTAWSSISDNIFVWDYGINFDNTVSPFPNFHILQKNIQLFKENNVTMHFSQVNGIRGGDFSELRAYMLGKLMWNPYCDADSLMTTFMNNYYGAAGRYLYRYQQVMQGALLASHQPLWIYDSPISHKNGMLCPNLIEQYDELFDAAEAAVANDSVRLARVRRSRLTLQYSKLEIARTDPNSDVEQTRSQLALFAERTRQFGVETLNERNNKPADYCELYKKRFLPQDVKSKALGASISYIIAPEQAYLPISATALTDGLYGGTTYVESWVGWKGTDAEFVVDLGEEKTFSEVSCDFLHQLGAWILLPHSVEYAVSANGQDFTPFGAKHVFAEDRELTVKFVEGKASVPAPVSARYVKVFVKGIGLCPDWHYGVGHPAWFFIDEVNVY